MTDKELVIKRIKEAQDKAISKVHSLFASGAIGDDTGLNAVISACFYDVANDFCSTSSKEVKNLVSCI
jgi:hypothetical protein